MSEQEHTKKLGDAAFLIVVIVGVAVALWGYFSQRSQARLGPADPSATQSSLVTMDAGN